MKSYNHKIINERPNGFKCELLAPEEVNAVGKAYQLTFDFKGIHKDISWGFKLFLDEYEALYLTNFQKQFELPSKQVSLPPIPARGGRGKSKPDPEKAELWQDPLTFSKNLADAGRLKKKMAKLLV
jgi:hypothetical protein